MNLFISKIQKEKAALKELQEYIVGIDINKKCEDIDHFIKLLNESGIDIKKKRILLNKMILESENDKRIINHPEIVNLLKEQNMNEVLDVLYSADYLISVNFSNNFYELIKKYYFDIMSISKYLSILDDVNEFVEIIEKLNIKATSLKRLISLSLESKIEKENDFTFIFNKNGIPAIQNDIDLLDPFYYDDALMILKLFIRDGINNGKFIKNLKNIDIYELNYNSIYMLIALKRSQKMIVSLSMSSIEEKEGLTENLRFIEKINKGFEEQKNRSYFINDEYMNFLLTILNQNNNTLILNKRNSN